MSISPMSYDGARRTATLNEVSSCANRPGKQRVKAGKPAASVTHLPARDKAAAKEHASSTGRARSNSKPPQSFRQAEASVAALLARKGVE